MVYGDPQETVNSTGKKSGVVRVVNVAVGRLKGLLPRCMKRGANRCVRQVSFWLLGSVLKGAIWRSGEAEADHVRGAVLAALTELRCLKLSWGSLKRFEGLRGKRGLKLNLGCGNETKPGWINIDLPGDTLPQVTEGTDGTMVLGYDLRLGLPLEDGSCDCVYSSHFLEHLEYRDGVNLMKQCYRVLAPGGVFRASLPDYSKLFKAYLAGDRAFLDLIDIGEVLPEVEPGTETMVDFVNYGVYDHGHHRCIYDPLKMRRLLKGMGYSSVVNSSYREEVDPSSSVRRRYSYYVEAYK